MPNQQEMQVKKFIYNGYGIAFDGAGSWSFGNGFARNVVNFAVDNSLRRNAEKS